MGNIKFDALDRTRRVITQSYLDWTTLYECYAVASTVLDPSPTELQKWKGWAIQRTEWVWTGAENTRWATNLSFPWASDCSAKDLATVQGYIYQ